MDALRSNYELAKGRAGGAKAFAIVKANAYGHGLLIALGALDEIVDGYGVVDFGSALVIRRAGYEGPVLMLNGAFDPEDCRIASECGLWLALHERRQVDWLLSEPGSAGIRCFLKVNTGMNRLGFEPEEALALLPELEGRLGRENLVLMTHFARADAEGGIEEPLAALRELVDATGLPLCASNAPALFFQEVPLEQQWVRCGIALYGSSPAPALASGADLGLQPAMTLRSRLISTRTLRKGEWIGYGSSYRAERDMPVGHAACGYGDGYPRHAGERGAPALVGGKRVSLVGRVSMDLLALDLSCCPGAKEGDEVVLFGEGLPVDEVAEACGTIGYDVCAGISASVPRKPIPRRA